MRIGLESGIVALFVAVIVGAIWRWRTGGPAPVGGLLLAAAATVALHSSAATGASVGLGIALALLAVAGLVGDFLPYPPALSAVLAIPGAWVLATESGLSGPTWIRALVAATAVIGGALAADFDSRHGDQSLAVPLFALSALGVYYTVPDTEQAVVLLAVGLVISVAAWPLPLVSLGSPGAFASVGLLAWVAAVGGIGRHSAIVGGVACLALLVAEPLSRIAASPRSESARLFGTSVWRVFPAIALQLLFVTFGSRVIGLRPTVGQAVLLAAVGLAVAIATISALQRVLHRRGS